MKHCIIILILIVGLVIGGCTNNGTAAKQETNKENESETTVAKQEWTPILEFSNEIRKDIEQIKSSEIQYVNYTVDNSITVDVTDKQTIDKFLEAYEQIEVGTKTNINKTDSGRRLTFHMEDGSQIYIGVASDDYITVNNCDYKIRNFEQMKKLELDLEYD